MDKTICPDVLVFSEFFLPGFKGGGPIRTIANLLDQVGDEIQFKLITSDRDLNDKVRYRSVRHGSWNRVGNSLVFYTAPGMRGYQQIFSILYNSECSLVYLNSFFSIRFSLFPLLIAKVFGKAVVLGPRGEFSEGALSLKRVKKIAFIKLYKLLGFHRGTVFQASSEFEACDIRHVLGRKVDVKVAEDIGGSEFWRVFPIRAEGPLKVIFVSRISPMKNLSAALEILCKVKESVCFHIYGPVEDVEYWEHCKMIIDSLPSHVHAKYIGELSPQNVVKTMAGYDLFFMPTKGENYGHVISEALCAGLPVLISDATPWRNLRQIGIGWDFPLDKQEAFSSVLDQLATTRGDEYRRMRESVLVWAKERFGNKNSVRANIELFQYALNKR